MGTIGNNATTAPTAYAASSKPFFKQSGDATSEGPQQINKGADCQAASGQTVN